MSKIDAPKENDLTFRPYHPADKAWVISRNTSHFRDVEGFNSDFSAAVTDAMSQLESRMSDTRSRYTIVEDRHSRIGCIFFCPDLDETGRIRLFYLQQEFRGQGIGKRVVSDIIDFAERSGFAKIRVSTFDRHAAACALYQSIGFVAVNYTPTSVFGQDMTQIDFELAL